MSDLIKFACGTVLFLSTLSPLPAGDEGSAADLQSKAMAILEASSQSRLTTLRARNRSLNSTQRKRWDALQESVAQGNAVVVPATPFPDEVKVGDVCCPQVSAIEFRRILDESSAEVVLSFKDSHQRSVVLTGYDTSSATTEEPLRIDGHSTLVIFFHSTVKEGNRQLYAGHVVAESKEFLFAYRNVVLPRKDIPGNSR